ncbi:MAG: tetratricopeptide repeat protein [Terriglobales bacterium]
MRIQLGSAIGLAVVLAGAMTLAASAQTYSSVAPPQPVALTLGERADIYMAERNFPEAVKVLQQALREHIDTAPIYNRLGIAYQQMVQLGKAQKYYKKAIKKDKLTARYRNNLGTVYYMRQRWKDAAKQFRQAIKLNPNKDTYFVNLGGALFAQKKYTPAIAAFRAALRLNPNALFPTSGDAPVVQDVEGADTARFHYDLARLFCSMGMLTEAVHEFSQAYDMHYSKLKESLTDPVFAPLRLRPEYRTLMGLPPLPPPVPHTGGGKTSGGTLRGAAPLYRFFVPSSNFA